MQTTHKLIYLIIFMFGVTTGAVIFWVNSYSFKQTTHDQEALLQKVMASANVKITSDNNACEGGALKTVGHVVASLIEENQHYKRNKLELGCYEETCSMSISACTPWQGHECSTRILKFMFDQAGGIAPSSFTCIDMP